jgi:hypothetical protein
MLRKSRGGVHSDRDFFRVVVDLCLGYHYQWSMLDEPCMDRCAEWLRPAVRIDQYTVRVIARESKQTIPLSKHWTSL